MDCASRYLIVEWAGSFALVFLGEDSIGTHLADCDTEEQARWLLKQISYADEDCTAGHERLAAELAGDT